MATVEEKKKVVERYVTSIEWIRELLEDMDDLADPVMGVRAWDDAVCVDYSGRRLVVSADGPYAKRLTLKSALVHAATDVVVKGARPLFALDTVIGTRPGVEEMLASLRRQAEAIGIPILGGNTLFEDAEPRCSLTVVGELLLEEPIRDATAEPDDILLLLGEPIWGEQEERMKKARTLFDAWYAILDAGTAVNASKDVTKGGLASVVYEMQEKSGREFKLKDDIPYPFTRNLDNFLISLEEKEAEKVREIASKRKCPLVEAGRVS